MGIYSGLPAAVRETLGLDDCEVGLRRERLSERELQRGQGVPSLQNGHIKCPSQEIPAKGRREDSIFIFLYDSHSCGQNHRGDASGNVWNRGNLRMHLSFSLF